VDTVYVSWNRPHADLATITRLDVEEGYALAGTWGDHYEAKTARNEGRATAAFISAWLGVTCGLQKGPT
jgi:hypothetical protein